MNINYKQTLRILLKRQQTLSKIYFQNSRFIFSFLFITLIPLFTSVTYFFFWLDGIVYRNLQDKKIKQPIFIFGHPRSGTSFIQERIAETGKVAYSTTRTLAFPSLILGKLTKPIVKLLSVIEFKILHSEKKGHKIEVTGIEEDEALFLHTINTELLSILCPWMVFEEYEDLREEVNGQDDKRNRELSSLFLKEYMKRQLVRYNMDRVVVKANPSIFRINQILKYFPDAKIIYLVRSPVDALRSFFSFHNRYNEPVLEKNEQERYFSNKYEWSKKLYTYFEKVQPQIPQNQIMCIPFPRIKNDLENLIQELCQFIDIEPGKNFWDKIQNIQNSERDKKYENKELSEFGLSEKKVKKELNFIWENYPEIKD